MIRICLISSNNTNTQSLFYHKLAIKSNPDNNRFAHQSIGIFILLGDSGAIEDKLRLGPAPGHLIALVFLDIHFAFQLQFVSGLICLILVGTQLLVC